MLQIHVRNIQKRQHCRDRKQMSSCLELRVKVETECAWSRGNFLERWNCSKTELWLITVQGTIPNSCYSESHSVVSDSLRPHGLYSPWNSPGQNTGVGSLSLLQAIFPIQGSNPGLPHCRQFLYQLRHKGSPLKYMIFPNCDLTRHFKMTITLLFFYVSK